MADMVQFELVSPERLIKAQEVEMVVIPGAEGDLGVLPGHSLLIAQMRPGVIDIHKDGKVDEQIFVASGFCEICPDRCVVLAEGAIAVNDIDKFAVEERLKLASSEIDESELRISEAMLAAISS
ncbi:MAG: ATP synthase F1 subunit epsilon [Rhodospirillaceae bacterium TMED8]|nr:ATP synthase F1 subunit epsilon [Magnetovibrio sp.]OUT48585.1 MAG: ATP synthase F1 subunit epsilon [Rhodospirillaceae bacterium TMED8]|tara:strand:- start:3339 stop:3710 length:372 start_codon:yes stop_codon:yes gene_type:complete